MNEICTCFYISLKEKNVPLAPTVPYNFVKQSVKTQIMFAIRSSIVFETLNC